METYRIAFCPECGQQMVYEKVPADLVEVSHYDSGGGSWWRLASPFNKDNGERNIAVVYRCPSYKRSWYGENNHDIFVVFKGEVERGIRIKK